mmetsp:Transcript_13219/g.30085  ORF Transcript_13219/g.30085 Transcript_13219/m.30085 type:complete len:173 (-) Transcript_13219:189-707(-)
MGGQCCCEEASNAQGTGDATHSQLMDPPVEMRTLAEGLPPAAMDEFSGAVYAPKRTRGFWRVQEIEEQQSEPPFFVQLELGDKKLGISVGHNRGAAELEILSVHETGLIPDWNKENPDKAVYPGCCITALNNKNVINKPGNEMLAELTTELGKSSVLLLTVTRPSGRPRNKP